MVAPPSSPDVLSMGGPGEPGSVSSYCLALLATRVSECLAFPPTFFSRPVVVGTWNINIETRIKMILNEKIVI